MSPPALVLVGPPGAGKTTVGRLLAERLGCPFRDTDADVAATAGKPVGEIFVSDGEEAFRTLERAAVSTALASHGGVLSLGGGAILSEDVRGQLRGHRVVFLNVGLGDAARRVGLSRDRPVLALNPRAALHSLLDARLGLYREVATTEVDTSDKTPAQVADEVLASLAS